MKFLHTADIHLDSPVAGLSTTPGIPLERLREATRQALVNLVDYAIAEAVDFLVIAGDLYDGTWRDYSTGLFLIRQMARLAEADIPVYIVLGNHDAESRLTRQLKLPDNVYVFPADRPHTVVRRDKAIALHGRSFPTAAVGENLALAYPPAEPGLFNIGLLHTGAGGREAHANYAPCALADLLGKGYDYWALGHVHAHEVIHEHPHVVFPGNLQGRHVCETGAKGFVLVRVEQDRTVAVDLVAADVVRWFCCTVDLSRACDFDGVLEAIDEGLAAICAEACERLAVVRLILAGTSPAHGVLVRRRDQLIAECQAAALRAPGELCLEAVRLETRPAFDLAAGARRPDAIGALIRSIDAMAGDAAARAALAGELNELVSRLPDELKADWCDDGGLDGARLDAVVAAARDLLVARILEGEADA